MKKDFVQRVTCLAVACALSSSPLAAQAMQNIRCESRNMHYQYCSVETKNHARLLQKHSFSDCEEGRSWGFDQHGVWVDHGCKGDFEVGEDEKKHDHTGRNIAIGAAVLGLAALAAAAIHNSANSQNSDGDKRAQGEVASWAIGNFVAQDSHEGTRVELHVSPGGVVNGRAGERSFSGQLKGNHLQAGRHGFRIEQRGNGFLAHDDQNSNHQVWFQRNGSDEPGGY